MGLEQFKTGGGGAGKQHDEDDDSEEEFLGWIDLDKEADGQERSSSEIFSKTAYVTDTVEEYENGKVMWCPCGAGIGVEYGVSTEKCYACKEYTLIDRGAAYRLDLDDDERVRGVEQGDGDEAEQSGLDDWM